MIVYVSIGLIALVTAGIAVWIYRTIDSTAHRAFKSFLPGANDAPKTRSTGRTPHRRRNTSGARKVNADGIVKPWGW